MSNSAASTETPKPATIAPTDFSVAIEAMRSHHLSRQGGDFFAANPQFQFLVTPEALAAARTPAPKKGARLAMAAVTATPSADELLQSVTGPLKTQQQSVADNASTGTNQAATDLKNSKDTSSFRAQLDAQRKKALDDSDTNINAAFDKAAQLGQDHPEMQSPILAGMNVVQNIISTFTGLISDMVGKVVSLISDILSGIMNGVEGVLGGFAESAGSVLAGMF